MHKSTILLIFFVFFSSCSNDDNRFSIISQAERNSLDDKAILKFLDEYYFTSNGKIAPCIDLDCTTMGETPLRQNATIDASGFVWIPNPNFLALGEKPASEESELTMHYDSFTFVSSENGYGTLQNSVSTINGSGVSQENPNFWKVILTTQQIESGLTESYFEIEGVKSALLNFSSTDRGANPTSPVVNFQGVVIVPSRLVYGREANGNSFGTDVSFVLNFELLSVVN